MEYGFIFSFFLFVFLPFVLLCVLLVALIRWLWRKGNK